VIHEQKITHSDLKPANFVLVEGKLKLIGFHIANAIANDTTNIHRDHPVCIYYIYGYIYIFTVLILLFEGQSITWAPILLRYVSFYQLLGPWYIMLIPVQVAEGNAHLNGCCLCS
jgi:serine/threonine protein kinase